MKQVQKSDEDPSCYEIRYLESHTCNTNPSTTKYSVSVSKEERNRVPKLQVTEQSGNIIEHMKSEELMLSLDDLENKKDIFRTFSFSKSEKENIYGWENLSPTAAVSGITNELLSASSVSAVNSPTDDSCFSSLENILDLSHDCSWM